LALSLAVLGLALLALLCHRPAVSPGVVVALAVVTLLTMLTKYNVGLPLGVTVALVSSIQYFSKEREKAIYLVLAAAVGFVGLFVFLLLKEDGFSSFATFVRNRANTSDWDVVGRILAYGGFFGKDSFAHPLQAVLAGLMALSALRFRGRRATEADSKHRLPVLESRPTEPGGPGANLEFWRRPAIQVLGIYGGLQLTQLSLHPYVVARSLLPMTAVLVLCAASSAVSWSRAASSHRGHELWLIGGVVACLLLWVGSPNTTRKFLDRLLPEDALWLTPVSQFIAEEMATADELMVVGTMNALSAPWMVRLWLGSHENADGLNVEFDPLQRTRERIEIQEPHRYLEVVDEWAKNNSGRRIIILSVGPHWHNGDFERWSAWSQEYVAAIDGNAHYRLLEEEDFLAAQVKVAVLVAEP
ncbi:MAG: hypothetical protein HN348_19500, partial [Proteobacteria bacterium]|nr:hypothetical protein [Pseudomonadota bacterium]